MRDLAKEKTTPIVQVVPNPATEAGLGFRRVHAADRRVLPAALNLDSAEDDPEGPFNSVWLYHLIGLACISCVKGGKLLQFSTLYTAKPTTRTTI